MSLRLIVSSKLCVYAKTFKFRVMFSTSTVYIVLSSCQETIRESRLKRQKSGQVSKSGWKGGNVSKV